MSYSRLGAQKKKEISLMNNDLIDGRWSEISEMIHAKWSRFSKKEVESLRLNMDDLVGKIRKTYGYAMGQAEKEYHEFRLALRPILAPVRSRK